MGWGEGEVKDRDAEVLVGPLLVREVGVEAVVVDVPGYAVELELEEDFDLLVLVGR